MQNKIKVAQPIQEKSQPLKARDPHPCKLGKKTKQKYHPRGGDGGGDSSRRSRNAKTGILDRED
jgi:hypothetical protein